MSGRFLADKSALARLHHPQVRDVLFPLADARAVATCSVVDLEVLFSARNHQEYEQQRSMRRADFPTLAIDQAVSTAQ